MGKGQINELTSQQIAFADYYLDLNNGTQSAIKAGYSPESAYSQASRALKNDKIVAYMAKVRAERRQVVHNKLSQMAEKAVIMLYDLAENATSETVRIQALRDIMDRGGYKPVDKSQNQNEINGKIEFGFADPSDND